MPSSTCTALHCARALPNLATISINPLDLDAKVPVSHSGQRLVPWLKPYHHNALTMVVILQALWLNSDFYCP